MSRSLLRDLCSSFIVCLFVIVDNASSQEAPDVLFNVSYVCFDISLLQQSGGPSYSPSSWSLSCPANETGMTSTGSVSGSTTATSITLNATSAVSGSNTNGGRGEFTGISTNSIKAYSKRPGTVIVTAESSADLVIDVQPDDEQFSKFTYWGLPTDYLSLYKAPDDPSPAPLSDSVTESQRYNLGCSPVGHYLPGSPYSEPYYFIPITATYYITQATAEAHCGVGDTVTEVSASGQTTLSFAFGADYPVAVISGPFVGGNPVSYAHVRDSVTLKNISYDPDNEQGTGERVGICTSHWTITPPPESGLAPFSNYNANATFTVGVRGVWTARLRTKDDEGMESETEITFAVEPQEHYAGACRANDPCLKLSCDPKTGKVAASSSGAGGSSDSSSGGGTSATGLKQFLASINVSTGGLNICGTDPTRTRGLPLANDININSQTWFPSRTTAMGNASFTYGMVVYEGMVPDGDDMVEHWFVIDEDGREINFGPTSGAPAPSEGVYSNLAVTQNGFEVTADAPGRLYAAGNFHYLFSVR